MNRLVAGAIALAATVLGATLVPAQEPPGKERSTTTKLLEAGAELLQGEAPSVRSRSISSAPIR